ncbi:hypothetical protein D3C86_868990 [compost metagenome]
MVRAHGRGRGRLPAPEELRGLEHLQRAAVALGLLRLDPLRVQVARLHLARDGAGGGVGAHGRAVAQVLHVQRRVLAREMAHGQRDAAQVLERVVVGQHAVEVGGARHQRRIDLREVAREGARARRAVEAAPVGVAHAVHVEPGHLRVAAAALLALPELGREHRFFEPGTVAALLVREHARGRPAPRLGRRRAPGAQRARHRLAVLRDGVAGLVERGHLLHGLVEPAHHVRELVAVRAGDADQHVHARPLQHRGRHDLDADHAPGLVPARLHAQRVEGLALGHALVARGLAGPEREGDLLRRTAAVGAGMRGDPVVHRGDAGVPGGARGHAAGVEAVEVAAGRQAVGVAHRVAAVARFQVTAIECGEQAFDFLVVGQHGVERAGPCGQGAQRFSVGRVVARQHGLQPARRLRGRDALRIGEEHLVEVFAHRLRHGLAEDLQDRLAPPLRIGRLAEGGQAQRLRGLRQLVEVRVQHGDEAREIGADARGRPLQVAVVVLRDEVGRQAPLQRGLHRAGRQRFPVVQALVHVPHAGAEARGREHGRRMAHHRRAAAALGGGRLAEVVHDVRVDVGHVAQREQRIVLYREPALLACRPLDRAVRAHMHQRIGAEAAAQPEISREVAVAQRHGRAVVDLLRLVGHLRAGLEARRLAQHDHLAELHARHHEGRCAGHGPQHRRGLGRAPVGFDAALRVGGQRAEPREVLRQRQRVGQALVEQRLQRVAALRGRVVGLHRGLHLRDHLVRARRLGAVAGRLHRGQHPVDAARHVEERRAEVRLARRVVVDQHRHAALGGGRAPQAQQRGGLVGHGVDLRGQRLQAAGGGVARGDEHRVGHACEFARAVVGRDVGLRQAILAARPLRRVHGQRGQRLQHRHADAFEFGLALVRAEHQRGVDEEVGDATLALAGVRHAEEQVLLLAWAVEGVGAQAALRERADQAVEPAGVVAGERGAVDGDGDGALTARQCLDGRDAAFDARPVGVIEARERQRHGVGQPGGIADACHRLHRGFQVRFARKAPVGAQPLRPGRIDAALGRERWHLGRFLAFRHEGEFADLHVGDGGSRNDITKARCRRLRDAEVRRIDDQQARAIERGGQCLGRVLRSRHHLQRHAGLARRRLQPHHARRRHQRRAQHHHARPGRHRRLCHQAQQPKPEDEKPRHFPPDAGTASAGT